MKTSFVKYGVKDGQDLCEISLENDHGMQVKLLNYGATLEKVLLNSENMILSLNSPEDYSKERNFLGGTVGRICGRVHLGQWKHGNHIFQLPKNDGENHIHGGIGTDMKVWNFKLKNSNQESQADLFLFDSDGDNGYPGNMKLHVTYKLDNENNVSYKLEAVSDQLTIFNPANHTYFNLGERATDLQLQLAADYYLPVGKDGLPNQGMQSVENTVFDFRKGKRIAETLNSDNSQIKLRNGLDHPFILNGMQPAAVLTSDKHKMVMTTNAPAIVTYTANHFNHTGIANNIGQYDGITLEAQCLPAEGINLGEITLLPYEKFERKINWNFS